ncbi:MAG: lipoprotein [Burkholderiales bacterium]|nr:lipoprotein [Burkholderiales bacterium]
MRRYLAVLFLFSLAACGYKGPLYLPKPTPVASKPQATPSPTPSPTPTAETSKQ